MASQPSAYDEERNLLRLRAWEQRNQETSQTKELNTENVPLFGQPYKTNKGDELSNRIQRMLGSYEDVNNSSPFSTEASPIPNCVTFSQSDLGQPNTDKSTKHPFHNHVLYMSAQSQKGLTSSSYSPQPARMSTASPNQGRSSTFSKPSLSHNQLDHVAHQEKKSDVLSDLREYVNLPQEMSAHSPDTQPLAFLHSNDQHNTDTDTKDTLDRHQLPGSTDLPSDSAVIMDVSSKDATLPQANKTNTLPSQTFPPLLSSKQPSIVMTQKPTAYVRPMDGQDQVVSESPELKPSPEPYVPLPEVINKSDLGKTKMMPPFLETRTDEAQCVEDILREMTHAWPPLLPAIHTPSRNEPSKSLFPAKEAEHVSSCPGQKNHDTSLADPSHLSQQSSSSSFEAAHSSGLESSSSDSGSSSGSESDNEESHQPPVGSSVKTEPDAPAVSHGDWQLGNWIRPSQQNSTTESQSSAHVSESPMQKNRLPTKSSKKSSVEVADPTGQSKPQLSSHQKESTDNLPIPQECRESPQDNCCHQSSQKSLSADVNSCSSSRKLSKPAKAGCPDRAEAAVSAKYEEVITTQTKEPCFTVRPKVKTKTGHGKKSSSDTKKDIKRTKRTPLVKQKAGSEPGTEAMLVQHGDCPSCGVHHPNPCSCPTQSPAQPDQLSSAPPVRISSSKPKPESICQRGADKPHKTNHKHLEKPEHTAKGSQDLLRPPKSLMVKIELSLLSRVPQTSSIHQRVPSNSKRSHGGGSDASTSHKHMKTSKKSIPQNIEADNIKLPTKKQKLENKNTSSHASMKLENSSNPSEAREQKKAKKNPVHFQPPAPSKDAPKGSKLGKYCSGKTQESSREAEKSKDSRKHKKSSGKHTEHPRHEKQKPPKSSLSVLSPLRPTKEALSSRPMLRFEERQHPVKHYIKEAKRLKHKADAESDKLSKAFNYLDAAMFFVESGIAMEKDPQISMSSYTMFAETVELLKFVLKLKNSVDLSAPPSEKDFIALCLKCQSLLQMAMFRHKHKTAFKYSKTLTDHFNNSAQATHNPPGCTSKVTDNPSPSMPSPANTSTNSGPGSNHSGSGLVVGSAGATVVVPQAIEQVAFSYVNITTLFLSAHDIWEQAEELAHKGSGMLAELDTAMGPLNLASSMSSMVRYTRQGVHWLRLDSQKV
ncbi:AF4/FMR2 family member 1 [Acanthochromis polyacanthus]|uniref:AF4/FMR2 family member 1-like n=1 Tax=Acanthochromis polyacanthus TaxID=80966 RepID=A0A3Q1EC50_9TELE|nr:AF4/FMR2 family member 1 [Acanthochromis polyacanthus]